MRLPLVSVKRCRALTLTGFETLSGLFSPDLMSGYKKSGMLPPATSLLHTNKSAEAQAHTIH
ncbi:hypothetical protein [Candidatus Kuenenia stuttgartiensis]|uniref:hypothetical protein n=1 Tax=Kuenenia stuttgartiensis TaxID=174633 RepID=UPI0012FEC757|nr:hypothetical protein [Candidatus Kuenenia stuttgartiensis]